MQFCGGEYVKVTETPNVYAMKVHWQIGYKILGYDMRTARRIWAFDDDCELIDELEANRIAWKGDPEGQMLSDMNQPRRNLCGSGGE